MAPTGSTAVELVVPIVATTAIGRTPAARSSAIAASSASTRSWYRSSVGIRRSPDRPRPRVMHALSIDECASADA